MKKKKSTRQLVGIESMTDSSVLTAGGELTFYLVQPTNLNVLPESGVRTRVTALLNVLKTSAEMELLALDAKESYQDNRLYYRRRAEEEGNPAIPRSAGTGSAAFGRCADHDGVIQTILLCAAAQKGGRCDQPRNSGTAAAGQWLYRSPSGRNGTIGAACDLF